MPSGLEFVKFPAPLFGDIAVDNSEGSSIDRADRLMGRLHLLAVLSTAVKSVYKFPGSW